VTGAIKAAFVAYLKEIDDGAVRFIATGPSGFGAWIGSIAVQVEAGDASLDAGVARIERIQAAIAPSTTVERGAVTLFGREGVRSVTTGALPPDAPPGSIPARAILYVTRLADGRTLWILASGPEAANGFDAMIDATVQTIVPAN
jgi:hypothetical protein